MRSSGSLIRKKGSKNEHNVTFVELFFDLVFVYSIAQLSHFLSSHTTWLGFLQAGLLTLAVWWVWVFTAWVTNWLDPDRMPVRIMLFVLMLLGLLMSSSIPEAFAEKGLLFAACFVLMQVGRSVFAAFAVRADSRSNYRNFVRITCWLTFSGIFWVAGGLVEGELRLGLWGLALAIEYASPAAGFFVPGLGRSTTTDWDVSGAHIAERCALFIIICLGEAILESGEVFAEHVFTPTIGVVLIAAFVGTVAMWWLYFQFGHERAAHHIEHSDLPGSLARQAFTYAHIPILAGIIVSVVGDRVAFEAGLERANAHDALLILLGPALFLAGNLWFKSTTARPPLSHLAGLVLLGGAMLAAPSLDVFAVASASTAILVLVAAWEFASLTRSNAEKSRPPGRN